MNSASDRPGNSEEPPLDLTRHEQLDSGAESLNSRDPVDESLTGNAEARFDVPLEIPSGAGVEIYEDEDYTPTPVPHRTKPKWSFGQKAILGLITLCLFVVVALYLTQSAHFYAKRLWDLSPAYCYVYIGALALLIGGMLILLAQYWSTYRKIPSLDQLRRKIVAVDPASQRNAQERKMRREVREWVDSLRAREVISDKRYTIVIKKFEETESLTDGLEKLQEYLLPDMDSNAKAVIESEAREVAILTALSPYGLIDSMFILWRNTRLVLRVAEIYGSRPGWWGNVRLLRRVLANVAAGAVTQEVMDWYYATYGGKAAGAVGRVAASVGDAMVKGGGTAVIVGQPAGGAVAILGMGLKGMGGLVAGLSEQLAGPVLQGFLSGILTIRMGLAAQRECRLLAMPDAESKQCTASLLSTLWLILPSRKKSSESKKEAEPT